MLYSFTVCPNKTALNELSGVIISPFYPRHYPTNQSGSCEIKARIRENEVFLQLKTWIFLCNAVEYGQNGMTRTPTKRFLKIHFELAYYGFISYPFGTNRQICLYTTVAPSKHYTRFQTKVGKFCNRFQTKTAQKPYPLWRQIPIWLG